MIKMVTATHPCQKNCIDRQTVPMFSTNTQDWMKNRKCSHKEGKEDIKLPSQENSNGMHDVIDLLPW